MNVDVSPAMGDALEGARRATGTASLIAPPNPEVAATARRRQFSSAERTRILNAADACNAGVDPRDLSFKHTVQLWMEWVSRGLSATKDCGHLFTLIAQCKVRNLPGRIEPRMRKRRPKPYPWLKIPRAQARRKIEKHGHAWET